MKRGRQGGVINQSRQGRRREGERDVWLKIRHAGCRSPSDHGLKGCLAGSRTQTAVRGGGCLPSTYTHSTSKDSVKQSSASQVGVAADLDSWAASTQRHILPEEEHLL